MTTTLPKTGLSIRNRIVRLWPALCLVLLAACQSAPMRSPAEEFRAADDYANHHVADIVVLPVQDGSTRRSGTSDRVQLPADELRQLVRHYLIEEKNYATPTSTWVDGQRERSQDLDTDAILSVAVNQWDTSALERRGVIYVSAQFELKSKEGEELWHYRCDDLQLAVAGPHGAQRSAENVREGARLLARSALSRMPRK